MPKPPADASSEIVGRIFSVRGQHVLLDADLASMYEVSTKRLNEQVRRNSARFPGDFTLTLSDQEVAILRSQFATSSGSTQAHGGRRYAPRALAVRRNRDRFPPDFLLEVDAKEWEILRSQIVTLRLEHGRHRKYLRLAFPEHGAIMAATLPDSPRAAYASTIGLNPAQAMRLMSKGMLSGPIILERRVSSITFFMTRFWSAFDL
jgi:hypothetical protein